MKETLNERVYRLVKADVTQGIYRPGTRIDVTQLANRLATSLTPVRMTLTRLSGEGLIELHTNEGFYLPRLTEPGLRDLFDWSQLIATTALRSSPISVSPDHVAAFKKLIEESSPLAIEPFLRALTLMAPNAELYLAMDRVNDRLRSVRITGAELMLCDHAQLIEMMDLLGAGDLTTNRITAYHNRQKALVPTLIRSLHTG